MSSGTGACTALALGARCVCQPCLLSVIGLLLLFSPLARHPVSICFHSFIRSRLAFTRMKVALSPVLLAGRSPWEPDVPDRSQRPWARNARPPHNALDFSHLGDGDDC